MNHCDPLNYWGAGDKREFSSGKRKNLNVGSYAMKKGVRLFAEVSCQKSKKKVC